MSRETTQPVRRSIEAVTYKEWHTIGLMDQSIERRVAIGIELGTLRKRQDKLITILELSDSFQVRSDARAMLEEMFALNKELQEL